MLLNMLTDYAAGDIYPMHMPGHKRNTALSGGVLPSGIALPLKLDITEIPGFDNLADPHGILLEMSELAAQLYGSARAFPLVGGSTCGILAAITALAPRRGKMIMARSSHISVYNAAELCGLETVYLLPQLGAPSGVLGSILPEDVEAALRVNPDASLVVITSPTYEGVVSDVGAIAEIAHRYGVPLLVDAAHGAHLGFSPEFPESAVRLGADIVVMSLHKTLPALTQCALLHVSGSLVDADAIARRVNIFGTSSPSYLLLASIDNCLRMIERDGSRLFADYARRLMRFKDNTATLRHLHLMSADPAFYGLDPGKIVISAAGCSLSGPEMARIMRVKYGVEPEMASLDYVVAMTSIADSDDGFERLLNAVAGLDDIAAPYDAHRPPSGLILPERADTISDALTRSGALIDVKCAAGMVALEYVYAYPPGVPLIVPGEVFDSETVSRILALADTGVTVMSTRGAAPERVYAATRRGST